MTVEHSKLEYAKSPFSSLLFPWTSERVAGDDQGCLATKIVAARWMKTWKWCLNISVTICLFEYARSQFPPARRLKHWRKAHERCEQRCQNGERKYIIPFLLPQKLGVRSIICTHSSEKNLEILQQVHEKIPLEISETKFRRFLEMFQDFLLVTSTSRDKRTFFLLLKFSIQFLYTPLEKRPTPLNANGLVNSAQYFD